MSAGPDHGAIRGLYERLPVSVQNAVVSLYGARRWMHERSRGFQNRVDWLLESQHASPDEIAAYRRERLIEVLNAAKNTKYYCKILPSEKTIEDSPFEVLRDVPVLSREDLGRNTQELVNIEYSGKLIEHGTSGTTGSPLQIYWTPECMDMERALIWRQRRVTGLEFGKSWRGMLGGHRIVPLNVNRPPYWRISKLAKQVYMSTYHLSFERAEDYLYCLRKHEIKHLEGYPSVLYALAKILREAGLNCQLEGIYYGAEPLMDFQRACIQDVFSCYIWDYYGLTERVASASEFECRNGLHENWENCFLEIVDEDGNVLPEGEYGELVGTSFSNLGFPLLRYRTGDMTRFLPGECTCGRSSRRMAAIDTKREDLLVMPDGSLLSASNLTYPFKEVEHVRMSQLYQEKPDKIEVRVVPADDYSAGDGEKLLAGLREFVPPGVSVELRLVEEIPRLASGKYSFCVSELSTEKNPPREYS